ncbi:MAG: hypothetical protein PHI03_00560 [Bacteroidales bacterium]|nr:hypothetical protein [Bacteroidales bacterium]
MKKSELSIMRKYLLVFLLAFVANYSYSINIPVYGRAGAEVVDGKVKICPGFAFNKCATISVTLQEVWDHIFKSDASEPPFATVTLYDADGNETMTKLLQVSEINTNKFHKNHAPPFIFGDDIIFK